MKRSDIEKRLQDELNKATPAAFDAIWAKCEKDDFTPVKERATERELVTAGANGGSQRTGNKGLISAFVALFLAIVLSVTMIFGAVAGWFDKGGSSLGGPSVSKGFLILDINPSVEVDYDENGLVSEAVGLNADGKALLYGAETELVGKSYEEAVGILFERCVRLGYFSATRENNAVLVSATKAAGGADEEMTERVRLLFNEKFVGKKMYGVAIAGKEDPSLAGAAAEYNIDTQKYALIREYLALAELLGEEIKIEESEYESIPIREIYEEIEDLQEELEEYEIGEKVADEIETLLERLQDEIEKESDALEELEEVAEEIADAKTIAEVQTCADALIEKLRELATRQTDPVVGEKLDVACMEIEQLLVRLNEDQQKLAERLNKTAEVLYKEREEKYKDDFDKEAEIPEGGFEAWQDANKGHFEDGWSDKKEEWKNHHDD